MASGSLRRAATPLSLSTISPIPRSRSASHCRAPESKTVAFSPDSSKLAILSATDRLFVFDLTRPETAIIYDAPAVPDILAARHSGGVGAHHLVARLAGRQDARNLDHCRRRRNDQSRPCRVAGAGGLTEVHPIISTASWERASCGIRRSYGSSGSGPRRHHRVDAARRLRRHGHACRYHRRRARPPSSGPNRAEMRSWVQLVWNPAEPHPRARELATPSIPSLARPRAAMAARRSLGRRPTAPSRARACSASASPARRRTIHRAPWRSIAAASLPVMPKASGISSTAPALPIPANGAAGLMDGKGRLLLANGGEYVGAFRAGRLEGTGTFIDSHRRRL